MQMHLDRNSVSHPSPGMDGALEKKAKMDKKKMPEEKCSTLPVPWVKLEGGGQMHLELPSVPACVAPLEVPMKTEPAETEFHMTTQLRGSDVLDVKIKVELHDPSNASDLHHQVHLQPGSPIKPDPPQKTEQGNRTEDGEPQIKVEVAPPSTSAFPAAWGKASQLLASLSRLNPTLPSSAPARLGAREVSLEMKSVDCNGRRPGIIPVIEPMAQHQVRPVFLVKNRAAHSLPGKSLLQSVRVPAPQRDRHDIPTSPAMPISCLMNPQGKPLYVMIVKEPNKQRNNGDQMLVNALKPPVNYICPVCKKNFTCQSAKLEHVMGVHGLIKRFCCNKCGKRFKWETSLRKHEQAVHEGVRYQCSLCSGSFTDKGSLKSHLEGIHSSVKRHTCPDCSKQFFWKSGMQRHIVAVHSKIRHTCTHCGKGYSDKCSLRKHVASVHADLTQPSGSLKKVETSSPGSEREASSPRSEEGVLALMEKGLAGKEDRELNCMESTQQL